MCGLSAICSPFRAGASLSPPSRPAHPLLSCKSRKFCCLPLYPVRQGQTLLNMPQWEKFAPRDHRSHRESHPTTAAPTGGVVGSGVRCGVLRHRGRRIVSAKAPGPAGWEWGLRALPPGAAPPAELLAAALAANCRASLRAERSIAGGELPVASGDHAAAPGAGSRHADARAA